jgi:hypothetical protein
MLMLVSEKVWLVPLQCFLMSLNEQIVTVYNHVMAWQNSALTSRWDIIKGWKLEIEIWTGSLSCTITEGGKGRKKEEKNKQWHSAQCSQIF